MGKELPREERRGIGWMGSEMKGRGRQIGMSPGSAVGLPLLEKLEKVELTG
jgi:hypothetical protein